MTAHRTLICTCTAIASGLFGAYAGHQLSAIAHTQACKPQPLGLNTLCKEKNPTPTVWGGSLTGFWVGAVLGAFGAGLVTHKTARSQTTSTLIPSNPEEPEPVWRSLEGLTASSTLELTTLQTEVLYCLMMFSSAQADPIDSAEASPAPSRNTDRYLPQFRVWAEAMAQTQTPTYDPTQMPDVQQLTVSETRQLLLAAGFSTQAVDQAWQILQAAGPNSSS